MAFGKYWIQLFLFCCSNNMSHDIFLLNRFLSVPIVSHSVVWICRADSSCKTQSLCFLMSDFVFPLTPVTTYLSSTFTDSTYQQGLYSICLSLFAWFIMSFRANLTVAYSRIFFIQGCSCSVVSYSLWPHGLQHTRLPCAPPSPRACSNSCPLSQ